MSAEQTTEFVPVSFLPAKVDCERRADGTVVLRSPEPLGAYARCLGEHLEHWANERPETIFLAQREGEGWRKLSYAEAQTLVRAIATNLPGRNFSAERPVAILSENSIEHALLALAAMHVGIPFVPVSTAYSLVSRDFKKLRAVFSLLTPGQVFADDGQRFAPALAALGDYDFELVVARNGEELAQSARGRADALLQRAARL